MKIVEYDESLVDKCAEFWWSLYEHMPYVHRPDGFDTVNGEPIGSHYFIKHLKAGLRGDDPQHWCGNVTDDSIFLAVDNGKVEGILITSIDYKKQLGNIISGFVRRNLKGRQVAEYLLKNMFQYFQKVQLKNIIAAPPTRTLEVESTFYLALLDTGFACDYNQFPDNARYGIFLGGSLKGFYLKPEITEKMEKLRKEGIEFERCTADQVQDLRFYDSGKKMDLGEADVTFVALKDNLVVGQAQSVITWTDWAEEPPHGRILGETVPFVVLQFRQRGIGKVLYHLGIKEIVKRGAECGFIHTEENNPARFIYRSIGYHYWYVSICGMRKHLQ